jgi:hypothetical protein
MLMKKTESETKHSFKRKANKMTTFTDYQELVTDGKVGDNFEFNDSRVFANWSSNKNRAVVIVGTHDTGTWYHLYINGKSEAASRSFLTILDTGIELIGHPIYPSQE